MLSIEFRLASLFALLFSVLQGWLLAQNFYNIAATQGLNFTALSTDNWGSGISFYDFDQDGWDDLCFAKENGIQEIYRNDAGNLVHPNFSISNFGQTKHLLWVDYNNDDYLDIFLTTKFGTIHLLENDGSFNFTEKTVQAGLASIAAANYGASFADYDRDGDLDLYLCKYSFTGDSLNLRDVNNLYRNNGDGTFTDQTFASGTSNGVKASFQSVWFDYDLDGWPDLFVINDRFAYPNALYHNNGDGSFSDISNSANLALQLNNPMTASVADFENDGDLDIFISNTSIPNVNDLPLLMLNQGNGFFEDKANSYNLIMNNTTWGGLWLDYDNNGLQDLYVATAFLDYSLAPQNSYFFRNNFPLTFQEDSSLFIGNHKAHSHAVARGDLNNDGFYDIAVHNVNPNPPFLWLNSGNGNNFIKIKLKGTVSNSQAIGSWIKVYAANKLMVQYTMCGENYLGQNSQHHIFGLGNLNVVDSVIVEYPSGIKDNYYNLAVNQSYIFTEGEQLTFELIVEASSNFCQGDSLLLEAPQFTSYQWSTGATSPSIQAVQSGLYFCVASDSAGLEYFSDSVQVDFFNPPIIYANVDSVTCAGQNDGKISLELLNSYLPYQISWSNGEFGDSLEQVSAGSYYFSYLDSAGCRLEDTVDVHEPFDINLQYQIQNESAEQLGSIELLINGGTEPYQVLLDSIAVGTFIDSLGAGLYSVEILDKNLCSSVYDIEILSELDSVWNSLFNTEERQIILKPNPVKDFFELEIDKEIQSITLMDLMGNRYNLELSKMQDLRSYSSGVYFLIVQLESQFYQKVFIKLD